MAQHDYVIANGTGAAVRSDLNNALAAIVSQNSGATAPSTTYAYMPWADTGSSPPVFKIRNAANNGWITLYELDGTFSVEAGSASSPGLYFTGDINTGIYSPGADQFGISTGGTSRLVIDASGNINMDSGTVYVDAANNRLGIGDTGPTAKLVCNGHVQVTGNGVPSAGAGLEISYGQINAGRTSMQSYNRTGSAYLGADFDALDYRFYTSNSERCRIDTSGRFLVGTSTARSNYYNSTLSSALQVEGTSYSTSSLSLVSNNTSQGGSYPILIFGKSAGSTVGSNTAVADGHFLGQITFQGNDGTEFLSGAEITAIVDGTSGANDLPTRLVFSTTADGASSPTERMRISATGQTAIFATATQALDIRTSSASSNASNLFIGRYSASSTTDGTISVAIRTNGDLANNNGVYGSLSDAKLKENIADANSQWADLKAIKIRNWNFKEETGYETHRQIGPIAQELEQVCPGLVFQTPDLDEDGNDTGEVTKGVNQSVLYMKAVKALQEAMERIEQLESEMAAVKAQLS